jgi:hypothetical protein
MMWYPLCTQFPEKYLKAKATEKYNDNTTVANFPEHKKTSNKLTLCALFNPTCENLH